MNRGRREGFFVLFFWVYGSSLRRGVRMGVVFLSFILYRVDLEVVDENGYYEG
jgi:hypothetical protein